MNTTDFIRSAVFSYFGQCIEPNLSWAIQQASDLTSRRTLPYHATASVFVINPSKTKTLLLHHKSLNKWLQPGGHIDAGETPVEAALREMKEELCIPVPEMSEERRFSFPVSIDVHEIPANTGKAEPDHYHIDFRYMHIYQDEGFKISNESISAEWRDIALIEAMDTMMFRHIQSQH